MRILYKDDITNFQDLLIKDRSETIHDRNIKLLAIEMYKAANNISPSTIADFLPKKVIYHDTRNKSNFTREKVNSIHYGAESLRILGPKLWDHLPSEIKSAQSLLLFKSKIKKWSVQNCPCRLCKTCSQFRFFMIIHLILILFVFKYFI